LGLLVIGFSILWIRNPSRFRKPIFSKRGKRIQS
jgi:hypothetical protein